MLHQSPGRGLVDAQHLADPSIARAGRTMLLRQLGLLFALGVNRSD
jgi:hypothetical protein